MVLMKSNHQAGSSNARATRKGQGEIRRNPAPDPSATNSLYLVAFRDGSKGFMARSQDCSSLAFFNEDGDPICCDPCWNVVVRELGHFAPCDEDGFWALVARA